MSFLVRECSPASAAQAGGRRKIKRSRRKFSAVTSIYEKSYYFEMAFLLGIRHHEGVKTRKATGVGPVGPNKILPAQGEVHWIFEAGKYICRS